TRGPLHCDGSLVASHAGGMMDSLILKWLRNHCKIQTMNPLVQTVRGQRKSYDPDRFAMILSGDATNIIRVYLGDVWSGSATVLLCPGQNFVLYDELTIGSLVSAPIWATASAVNTPFFITTLSYTPERKSAFDKFIHKQLSDAGAL